MVPLIMVAAVCASVPGLIPSQLKQCQVNPNAMFAVSEGTRRGLNECQLQFTNERWNCTPDGVIHKSSSLVDQLYHHQPHPHPHLNSNANFNNNQFVSSNVIQNSNINNNNNNNLPTSNSIQSRNSIHHQNHSPISSSTLVPGHTVSSLEQFSNLSSKHFQLLAYPIFNQTLKHESRESAFLYAITSAGVVHAVTEACASGNLTECSCDRSRSSMPMNLHSSPSTSSSPVPFSSPLNSGTANGGGSSSLSISSASSSGDGWKWGGCSDNVRYGMVFAKSFLDAPDRRLAKSTGELKYLMNLHNNHVGRLAVSSHMELRCRCHGISGSCELKTCWRTLPSFTIVGKFLKEKYETAVQVSEMLNVKKKVGRSNHVNMNHNNVNGHGLTTSSSSSASSSRRRSRFKKYTLTNVHREDLVYIKKSPNYCIEDRKNGIYGTSGRICSKTSDGPDSCQLLCCGRGYNTKIKKVTTRCNCKFEWCCNVQCEICDTETEVYTCK